MANSTPESEFDLKKRLVGAFILIGFGIVVLPALLGGDDPKVSDEQTQPTPSLESKVFVSKITPIGGATPKPLAKEPQSDQDEPVESKAPEPQPATSAELQVSKVETQPEPKQKSQATPEPKQEKKANAEPGWVVRVGTFAKADNTKRVMERLRQAGFDPSTTKVKTDKGSVTRVWIGPYAQRVEAARMRNRVKQVTGGDAFIAAYP